MVDFHVPGVAPEVRDRVGQAYARVYETLYDEDSAMMSSRQEMLDSRITPRKQDAPPSCLGHMDTLNFPLAAQFSGRDAVINVVAGSPVVHVARCPHLGAPLITGKVTENVLECPWHGYRFDLDTGQCLSGADCSIAAPFEVWIADGALWIGVGKKG